MPAPRQKNSIFFFPPFGVLIFSPPTADTFTVGQKQRKPYPPDQIHLAYPFDLAEFC